MKAPRTRFDPTVRCESTGKASLKRRFCSPPARSRWCHRLRSAAAQESTQKTAKQSRRPGANTPGADIKGMVAHSALACASRTDTSRDSPSSSLWWIKDPAEIEYGSDYRVP